MTLYSELFLAIEQGEAEPVTEWARGVLHGISTGQPPVDMVIHPLGFLCVPAHRSDDKGACVHLWGSQWRRAVPTTSSVHCHSWDLLSWILVGELHNRTVHVVDDVETPTHQVFEVHSGPDGDVVEPTGRLVRAEVQSTSAHRAGERYSLPAGIFHETVVPATDDLVVTVALGVTRTATVDLSLGGLRTAGHRVRRRACVRNEAVRAARIATRAIANTCAIDRP